jgi:hypothetical protein
MFGRMFGLDGRESYRELRLETQRETPKPRMVVSRCGQVRISVDGLEQVSPRHGSGSSRCKAGAFRLIFFGDLVPTAAGPEPVTYLWPGNNQACGRAARHQSRKSSSSCGDSSGADADNLVPLRRSAAGE